MNMNTVILPDNDSGINQAVELLKAGQIVAVPTETVYGLAGNALAPSAIRKIFEAKNRPQDNPLIVHVSDMGMVRKLGLEIPPLAEVLAEKFWPGPLTMIFKKRENIIIPEISCGLDTVAVRVPANGCFCEIISRCGFPIAAPSANLSGSPSPTSAKHVYDDLKGRIPLIVDGGDCEIGIESTVIMFTEAEGIRILRPGAVTPEMLSQFADVEIVGLDGNPNVVNPTAGGHERDDCRPLLSPGMAHKHYSPKAKVIAVVAESAETFLEYTNGAEAVISNPAPETLFAKFREFDENGVEQIFVRLPEPTGIGLALYNRIIRAAEFDILIRKETLAFSED